MATNLSALLGPAGANSLTGIAGEGGYGGLLGMLLPLLIAAHQQGQQGQARTAPDIRPAQPAQRTAPDIRPPAGTPSAQGYHGIGQGRYGALGPAAAAASPTNQLVVNGVPPAIARRVTQATAQQKPPSLGQVAGAPQPFSAQHPAVARIGALLAARKAMGQQSPTQGSAPGQGAGAVDLLAALHSSPFMRAGAFGTPSPAQGNAPTGPVPQAGLT